jgi:F-type H+-transporting ATPase subunit c
MSFVRKNIAGVIVTFSMVLIAIPAFAEEAAEGVSTGKGLVAIAAGILLGLAALGGTLSQGKAVSSALDSIGRNPGASGKLFVQLILGLALIESLVILSFVVASQIVGKL